MTTNTLQLRKKGNLTLPVDMRQKYNLGEGDLFTLVDMGDGSFMLTPRSLQVNRLGDRITKILKKDNISLEDLLNTLEEDREQYYREHFIAD